MLLDEIEGNDFVLIDDDRLAEATNEASTTDKIVDITKECGQVPWQGIEALQNVCTFSDK